MAGLSPEIYSGTIRSMDGLEPAIYTGDTKFSTAMPFGGFGGPLYGGYRESMTEDDLPSVESVPTDEEDWDPEDDILKMWGPDWREKHCIKVTSESFCPGLEAGWMVCELCHRQLAGMYSMFMHLESRNHRRNLDWWEKTQGEDNLEHNALPAPDGWIPPNEYNAFQPSEQTELGTRRDGGRGGGRGGGAGSRSRSTPTPAATASKKERDSAYAQSVRNLWAQQNTWTPPPPTESVPPPPPPPPGDPAHAAPGGGASHWLASGMHGGSKPFGTAAPPPPVFEPPLASAPPPPPGPPPTGAGPPPPMSGPPMPSGPPMMAGGPPPPSGAPPMGMTGLPPSDWAPPMGMTGLPPSDEPDWNMQMPTDYTAWDMQTAPADGTYVVATEYNAEEMEEGYLPLELGMRVTLLSEATPGNIANRYAQYAFGQLPSGVKGWVPVACLRVG